MAANMSFYDFADYDDDDDFIDMELSSSSPTANFYYSPPLSLSSSSLSSSKSSPQNRDFEFQMCFTCNEREAITSPADDLFFKGTLLPLYLPTRQQMIENILCGSSAATRFDLITEQDFEDDEDYYSMPFTEPCTIVTNTPLESSNISPLESCRVSCELCPDDYCLEWSTESGRFISNKPKKNTKWSDKLKIIKHSILGEKLRASSAYLKSLFGKSTCSDKPCRKANCNARSGNVPKSEDKHLKIGKKNTFGLIERTSHPRVVATMDIDRRGIHNKNSARRKSFSSAIRRHSPNKCLSSSSSNSSSSSSSFSLSSVGGFPELHFLRRASSATEIEGSIEAAIAYCKKTQQIIDSRNTSRGS